MRANLGNGLILVLLTRFQRCAMDIAPIGLITFAIGCVCLLLGYRATVAVFIVTTMLTSAAALTLGTADIKPSYLFLAFVLIATLLRQKEAAAFLRALHPSQPGFWLACLVAYAVVSAFVFPRLLFGATGTIPLSGTGLSGQRTVPLAPVSSNLTQSVYLCGNLACFAAVVAIASTRDGFRAVLIGLVAFAICNCLFALLDIATYAAGISDVLGFMRNARYEVHADTEIANVKRIVGSFTEAAGFSRATLGSFGLMGTLWLAGYRPFLTGTIAIASIGLAILSTSTTGLAGAPFMMLLLYFTALKNCSYQPVKPNSTVLVICAPVVVIAAGIILFGSGVIQNYLNIILLEKLNSPSGIERTWWNEVAFQNFVDTWGIGAGLGSARASTVALAILSNVGIIGALLYIVFFVKAFTGIRRTSVGFTSDVRLAARNACFGLFIGDLIVGATVDQGLYFYVLAALASANPDSYNARRMRMRPAGAFA
jgi:hypothetical protein